MAILIPPRIQYGDITLRANKSPRRTYSCCRNQCAGAFSTRATQNAQNAQSGRILPPLNCPRILRCFGVPVKLEIMYSTRG
ncbi:hypothetical protein C8Q70DRAFT_1038556 [Cubamyces menziesii]|nr:hypothetical protein C8Q70DRAFT_1038556 [Cubamyces menziesii]